MIEVQSIAGQLARMMTGLEIDLPVVCRIGKVDDQIIATGGLAWAKGRCWLFFDVQGEPRNIARQALRECQAMFRRAIQLGETEVYTPRDAAYPTSERLCRMAGFEKTDEVLDGKEIWRVTLHKEIT